MRQFEGRVRFVVENYGDSELARRFGVTRYPAIFVDDILVATPKDFGFYGDGEGPDAGRYAPWRDAKSHERFRSDLRRMLETVLSGRGSELRAETAKRSESANRNLSPPSLPDFVVTALDGAKFSGASLRGKPLLVEFWATWCPPCRGTLSWLGDLKQRQGDRFEVVALAVESDLSRVREVASSLDLPIRWAMASPELALKFGDLAAVPTLFLFDAEGRTREIYYGAPPDLHERVERELAALVPHAGS